MDFPLGNGVYSFRDFNVITFNDYVANTGDIEGRLAAKRDVTFGNGYSIGHQLQTSNNVPDNSLPYSLVVGRDLIWLGGSLHPDGSGIPYIGAREDMFVGRDMANVTDYLIDRQTGGPCSTEGCLDKYFDAAQQCYLNYQEFYGGKSDNVDKSISFSGLFITCQESNVDHYYISLTPEEMAQYTYTVVDNCNFQAKWTLNIRGNGDVTINGASFPGIAGGVVYNVIGSGRTITVDETDLQGHLLAPFNTLYQPGGVINGKVVAADITMALQINKQNQCPYPGTVEIPTTENDPVYASSNELFPVVFGGIRAGDSISFAGQSAIVVFADVVDNKATLVLDRALTADVPAGTRITARVDGTKGRPGLGGEMPSSASIVSVTIALMVALIVILFLN
jgi:choice-of-anchor A domain-containing protein